MIHPAKLLKELGINPLKQLGQNFQIDTHVVENAAHQIPTGVTILEIGPGLGAWTEVFLARGHKMVLAEKDRTLAARWRQDSRVELIEGDFLEMDCHSPPIQNCLAAVGNLPFYITSDILLRLIVDCRFITHGLFGIQLEVAERLIAAQGSSLTIALNSHGSIKMAGRISRSSFYPAPNVDVAIISFTRNSNTAERPHFRLLLKAAFWGKRKALSTSLKKNPFWATEGAPGVGTRWAARIQSAPPEVAAMFTRRADDLTVSDFCALYDFLEAD